MSLDYLHKLFTSGKAPFIWDNKVFSPTVSSVRLMDNPSENLKDLSTYQHEFTGPSLGTEIPLPGLLEIASFGRRALIKELQKTWFSKGTGIFASTDLQTAKYLDTPLYKPTDNRIVLLDAYTLESALKSLVPDSPFFIDIDNNYLYIYGKVLRKQEETAPLYAIPHIKEEHYGRQLLKMRGNQ